MQGSQNGAGPTVSPPLTQTPSAPESTAADQPALANKPSLRAPPSRPPSRQPIDLDRLDLPRGRPMPRNDRQQNGSQNGAGQPRPPRAAAPAPIIPGGPVESPIPGARPGTRGGKKGQEDEDDKGKGKGGSTTILFTQFACFHTS